MSKVLYKISQSTEKVQIWQGWTKGEEVHCLYGQQGGKQTPSMYTAEPKNVGRSNETTAEEQAEIELEAMYKDQIDNKHYRESQREAQVMFDNCKVPRKVKNYKDDGHKMSNALYSSCKKDGSRACVLEGTLYSKIGREEDIKVDHLRNAVEVLGKEATFDSEVYGHNMSLQRIRSAWLKPIRKGKELEKAIEKAKGKYDPNEEASKLKFHVFDIPVKGVPYEQRLDLMEQFEARVRELGLSDCFEFIYPRITYGADKRLAYRDEVVADGYEGLVHYEFDDLYKFGIRTGTTMKDKPRYDAEARVVAVEKCKNGDGKLVCVGSDALENVKFKCMMKVKRRDGVDYPRDYDTMVKMINQWITFSYEDLSDKGVPTKPVGELPRKCDNEGNPLE